MSANRASRTDHTSTIELLLATVSCGRIGVPLSMVRRVFLVPELQPIPSARAVVLGCAQIEGEAIVFVASEASKTVVSPTDVAILVEDRGCVFALVVESIGDIAELAVPAGELSRCAGVRAASIAEEVLYLAYPGDLVTGEEIVALAEVARQVLEGDDDA